MTAHLQTQDEATIRDMIARWRRAVERKDVAGIIADYTPETLLYDAIPPVRTVGAAAIGKLWSDCFPYFPDRFTTEHRDLVIEVSGDLAFAHGLFRFIPEEPGHPCGSTAMRVTSCYRRSGGAWKIVHEHVSVPFDPMANQPVFIGPEGEALAATACTPAQATEPGAVHKVSPHLVCRDAAKAIAFYKAAFGATETMRLPGPDGRLMHAGLIINGSSVLLADEFPEHAEMCSLSPQSLKGTPVTIHLPVADVDAAFAKALAAGAKAIMPVADMFWGDRYGVLEDPFGHRWSLATSKAVLSQEELLAAADAAMADCPPARTQ